MARIAITLALAIFCMACGTLGTTLSRLPDQARGEGFAEAGARERLTIQTGSTMVEVEELEPSVAAAQSLVAAAGGSVTSSTIHEASASLKVRVPADSLPSFLASIAELGEEQARSTTSEDVTESYADLEAEIANLRALRDRLRTLLDRAKKVEEVLQVERELTRVQTRLDSLEGRRQRMATDVQLSAVSIQLLEKRPPRILGPLGLLLKGTHWIVTKLFVLSP